MSLPPNDNMPTQNGGPPTIIALCTMIFGGGVIVAVASPLVAAGAITAMVTGAVALRLVATTRVPFPASRRASTNSTRLPVGVPLPAEGTTLLLKGDTLPLSGAAQPMPGTSPPLKDGTIPSAGVGRPAGAANARKVTSLRGGTKRVFTTEPKRTAKGSAPQPPVMMLVGSGRSSVRIAVPSHCHTASGDHGCPVRFVAQGTKKQPGARVWSRDLHLAYASWCRRNGTFPLSQDQFGISLSRLGFARGKSGCAYYKDIALVDQAEAAASAVGAPRQAA